MGKILKKHRGCFAKRLLKYLYLQPKYRFFLWARNLLYVLKHYMSACGCELYVMHIRDSHSKFISFYRTKISSAKYDYVRKSQISQEKRKTFGEKQMSTAKINSVKCKKLGPHLIAKISSLKVSGVEC